MKLTVYIILFLLSCGTAIAQCRYADYEAIISKNCRNCNLSQENIFVYKKCRKADSALMRSKERFHNKLIKTFTDSKTERDKIEEMYNKSFEALIQSRSIVFKNYDAMTSPGDNTRYTQLFYWYFTDKANEILKDMESTIFGD